MHLQNFLPHVSNPTIKSILYSIIQGISPFFAWYSDEHSTSASSTLLNASFDSALIYIEPKIWLLIGNPHNSKNNSKFQSILQGKAKELKKTSKGYYKIFYDKEEWIPIVKENLMHGLLSPIEDTRICYVMDIPSDPVKFIDDNLRTDVKYVILNSESVAELSQYKKWDWVIEEMSETWVDLSHFLQHSSIGVVALSDVDEVIGWILSEFQTEVAVGVGIEVSPSFRKKGIATNLTRIYLKEVEKKMISSHEHIQVLWDAWHFNETSLKVAKRVGFSNRVSYSVLYGFWDESSHFIELSYYWRDRSQYSRAAKFVEKAIQISKTSPSYQIYYLAACNYALANNSSKAFSFLKLSLEACSQGKEKFKEHIKKDEDMQNLTNYSEFARLLKII